MKLLAIAIACVVLNANVMHASAQEIESKDLKNRNELNEIERVFETTLTLLQKFSDIAKREMLKETSARDLRFRCGRYWVDAYSKLISHGDREIGTWGVDSPAQSVIPTIPRR